LLQENTKITSGVITAPADRAARGGPWFREPPNVWNTKICCEFFRNRFCSSRKSLDACYEIWESRGIPTDYLPS